MTNKSKITPGYMIKVRWQGYILFLCVIHCLL